MRLFLALSLLAICAVAQDPPKKEGGKKGPNFFAEPKNLKVLKISGDQLRDTMRAFNAALGVNCNHCHAQPPDFASDANPKKEMARTMIAMTREINGHFPSADGNLKVRCYTCHRGVVTPLTAPPETGDAAKPPAK